MALKEIVDRDCGGANPLMKLTSHFTEDKALKQHGLGRTIFHGPGVAFDEANHDELVNEFLTRAPVDRMPTSFRMDSLLQEVQEIENMYKMPIREPITERNHRSAADDWIQEYKEEFAGNSLKGQTDWADEYLDVVPSTRPGLQSTGGLWADEFLEFSEKGTLNEGEDWANELPSDEVIATVDDLLQTVDSGDPKFKNSKFVKFLYGVRDGSIKLEEKPEKERDLLIADKWVNEFTEEQRTTYQPDAEDSWVHEYVERNFAGVEDRSWEDWSQELRSEGNLAEQWSDEFKGEQEVTFWENLQKQWEDLARQDDSEVQNWISSYDNFDTSTYYKDYMFEERNPLLDHPDAFQEGMERLKKGEISNAVLLFEAAVRKKPDHQEAWQYLGTTQAANEQDPAAIAALQKCLELNSSNLTALMALAVSYTNESLQQNACRALSDWIQHNPKYSRLLDSTEPLLASPTLPRVTSFASSDYHQKVEEVYLKAVQSTPHEFDPDVQIGLGILLNLSAEYAKAVDCFQAALQLKPDDAMIWNKLGATLSNGGRSEEAVEAFRHALNIVPGYVRTRHNLGLACTNLGADKEAMEHFLAALNLQKNGSGPKGARLAMSDNMWSSVRMVIIKMGRSDLLPACDNKDLDTLKKEFNIDV